MKMGCFPSKDFSHERRAGHHSSSDDGDSNSNENAETPVQVGRGRIGIVPISISSTSSSSGSGSLEVQAGSSYRLVGKLAAGVREISDDDESSIKSCSKNAHQKLFSSPDATFTSSCDQSMDDMGDESVVDWLAESRTSLYLTTTIGGPFYEEEKQQTSEPKRFESMQKHSTVRSPPEQQRVARESDLGIVLTPPKQAAAAVEREGTDKHVVKDTIKVERRRAPLPINTPSATGGTWLTNRYVVNDYVILSEIGKGAHSEVRLCKNKKSNVLFAAKVMNRKLLQSKIVDIQKEVAIMKKLRHPNILRLYEVLDDPKVNNAAQYSLYYVFESFTAISLTTQR